MRAHQSHDQAHARVIDVFGLAQLGDLIELCALDQAHDHNVARVVDRLRHGKTVLVEHPHESILLDGREPRQVQPRGRFAVLQVVTLRLDVAEGGAAEAVDLAAERLLLLVRHQVDIGLLADADLLAKVGDGVALPERVEGQVVVAHRREPVGVVLPVLVVQQLVLVEQVQDLVRACNNGRERELRARLAWRRGGGGGGVSTARAPPDLRPEIWSMSSFGTCRDTAHARVSTATVLLRGHGVLQLRRRART